MREYWIFFALTPQKNMMESDCRPHLWHLRQSLAQHLVSISINKKRETREIIKKKTSFIRTYVELYWNKSSFSFCLFKLNFNFDDFCLIFRFFFFRRHINKQKNILQFRNNITTLEIEFCTLERYVNVYVIQNNKMKSPTQIYILKEIKYP